MERRSVRPLTSHVGRRYTGVFRVSQDNDSSFLLTCDLLVIVEDGLKTCRRVKEKSAPGDMVRRDRNLRTL